MATLNEKKRTAKQVVDSCYADISLIVKNIDHNKEKKLKKQANK